MLINNRKKWHTDITDEVLEDAEERRFSSLDNPGFCLACGFEQDGCEPDARRYECESCGAKEVYGSSELLLTIF